MSIWVCIKRKLPWRKIMLISFLSDSGQSRFSTKSINTWTQPESQPSTPKCNKEDLTFLNWVQRWSTPYFFRQSLFNEVAQFQVLKHDYILKSFNFNEIQLNTLLSPMLLNYAPLVSQFRETSVPYFYFNFYSWTNFTRLSIWIENGLIRIHVFPLS